MFYGGGRDDSGNNRGGPRGRSDRYEQMTKQQQLIENKKLEIQKRIEEERHKKTMEALMTGTPPLPAALGSSSSTSSTSSAPISSRQNSSVRSTSVDEEEDEEPKVPFANDGSFLEKFKRMQEEKNREKEAEERKKLKQESSEYGYGPPGAASNRTNLSSLKIIDPNCVSNFNNPQLDIKPSFSSGGTGNYKNNQSSSYPPPKSYSNVPPPPPPPPKQFADYDHRDRDYRRRERSPPQQNIRGGFGYQNAPPPPPPPPISRSISSPVLKPQPNIAMQTAPPPPPPQQKPVTGFPSEKVKKLAADVAERGDVVEIQARITNKDDPMFWFLSRPDSAEYGLYRDLVTHLKFENAPPSPPKPLFQPQIPPRFVAKMEASSPPPPRTKRSAEDDEDEASKRRRSRWGPQGAAVPPPAVASFTSVGKVEVPPPPIPQGSSISYPIGGLKQEPIGPGALMNFAPGIPPPGLMTLVNNFMPTVDVKGPPPMLTRVTRTNPQLLSYARQSYGTVDLDDEQWQQCEEAYKMNLLFQDIARKKAKDEQMAMAGKFKHEYDSDEEVDDGGTWEHKQRMKEMEKTKDWAHDLTSKAHGKHHIGDFLPPEELEKFMDKYKAVKEGRQMDESAYQDFKIAQDNVGFKLLQKMGWNDGQGLGSSGQGIIAPIDKGAVVSDHQGLGVEKPSELRGEDDEYSAYRKRMMLAYRFRPNPLNNPRRAYY